MQNSCCIFRLLAGAQPLSCFHQSLNFPTLMKGWHLAQPLQSSQFTLARRQPYIAVMQHMLKLGSIITQIRLPFSRFLAVQSIIRQPSCKYQAVVTQRLTLCQVVIRKLSAIVTSLSFVFEPLRCFKTENLLSLVSS